MGTPGDVPVDETPEQRIARLQKVETETVESIRVYPVFVWAREDIGKDGARVVNDQSKQPFLTLQEALQDAKAAAPEGVGVWVDYSQRVS